MARFFDNQKHDAAGVVGITLQKLLIFFMFISALLLVCGVPAGWSFLFHLFIFIGVYKRIPSILFLYVVVNVVVFFLVGIVLVLIIPSAMYVDSDASADSIHSSPTAPSYLPSFHNVSRHNGTSYEHSSSSYSYDIDDSDFFLLATIGVLLGVIIVYNKILSIILAHKMRNLLLSAPVLPVSEPKSQEQPAATNNETETAFLPETIPEVGQDGYPGFAPYPMMPYYPLPQEQFPGMMQHPYMIPMYYPTYPPMPFQPPAPEDKN